MVIWKIRIVLTKYTYIYILELYLCLYLKTLWYTWFIPLHCPMSRWHDVSRQDTGQRRQAMVRTQDSGASDVKSGPVTLWRALRDGDRRHTRTSWRALTRATCGAWTLGRMRGESAALTARRTRERTQARRGRRQGGLVWLRVVIEN